MKSLLLPFRMALYPKVCCSFMGQRYQKNFSFSGIMCTQNLAQVRASTSCGFFHIQGHVYVLFQELMTFSKRSINTLRNEMGNAIASFLQSASFALNFLLCSFTRLFSKQRLVSSARRRETRLLFLTAR